MSLSTKEIGFAFRSKPFRHARWRKLFASRRWALLLVHWPKEHEFDAGSWERSGRCPCGEVLPPQQSWNNAGSEYQSITCGACGRHMVDEEDEFGIYDSGVVL